MAQYVQKAMGLGQKLAGSALGAAQGALKSVPMPKMTVKPDFWPTLRAELAPPTMDTWPAARDHAMKLVDSAKKLKFLDVSLTTATTNTLIVVEVLTWFYVGEIIGRRHLIGYKVPSDPHAHGHH